MMLEALGNRPMRDENGYQQPALTFLMTCLAEAMSLLCFLVSEPAVLLFTVVEV